MSKKLKQKWIDEGGTFYPIPGDTTLHENPGPGIFQISQQPGTNRLGLNKIAEKFTFDFKIYDLGMDYTMQRALTTWNSDDYVRGKKNFGLILNGLKGTGKTITAKILSNKIGLPVIVVNRPYDGLVDFIQSLCHECTILIDEAEKVFEQNDHMLLRIIDGVFNESRKFYILTTNHLRINENLKGRPSRIWYIEKFGNITPKAISEYMKDNLRDQSKAGEIIKVVNTLEICTIDILQALVLEMNIHGNIDENLFNIPRAHYQFEVYCFNGVPKDKFPEVKNFIKNNKTKAESVGDWLDKSWVDTSDGDEKNNSYLIDKTFGIRGWDTTIASPYSFLYENLETNLGPVLEKPDSEGFFVVRFDDKEMLCCIIQEYSAPSIYRDGLASVF